MDSRTGELLTVADYPTYDASDPYASTDNENLYKSAALTDVYEPGSVEKVLTLSSLIDAGKVTNRTRFRVPGVLERQDRPIHDYWEHGLINLTLAGIVAKSSNIGTVLAADEFRQGQLRSYLTGFGLGQRTDIGVGGETKGLLPSGDLWTDQTEDRIAFGQGLSVNAVQMAAAVNTIANGGVRIDPSLVQGSAVTDDGSEVGTDHVDRHRVISDGRRLADDADDGAGHRPRRRRRAGSGGAGLPGRRQDGHGAAGRTRVPVLRRHVHRLLRRLRARRRPAVHHLRGGPQPEERRWRWLGRRPGVRQADGLHAAPLRRTAHRHAPLRGCPSSGDGQDCGRGHRVRSTRLARRLADLVAWLSSSGERVQLVGDPEVVVTGLSLSSQRVRPGDLYAALPGTRAHGIGFVGQALSAGAVAVLTDSVGAAKAGSDATVVIVDRPRELLGRLAAWLYDEPATALRMIGVTGTQGKTTTVRLAEAALQAAGVRAASIGTVGTRVDGRDVPTSLTTPEAPDLHGLFAMMRESEVRACAMEVSSHALVMGRVDGVVFDVAVFLNLGRDHLDFHSDEEDYFLAKASLFTPERARLALVDVDDDHGRRLAGETSLPVRTLSLRDPAADWRAEDVVAEATGSRFTAVGPGGVAVPSAVHLPGDFNVANALAAVAACVEAGFDAEAVAAGLARTPGVPGRLERVDEGQDFLVLVDYAHKPDAVAAALRTLRPLTERPADRGARRGWRP